MATVAQLRYSPLSNHYNFPGNRHVVSPNPRFPAASFPVHFSSPSTSSSNLSSSFPKTRASDTSSLGKFDLSDAGGNGGSGSGRGTGGGGNDGWNSGHSGSGDSEDRSSSSSSGLGILGLFLNGWRSRVGADPQFPFKVLMEEIVGVSACVLGDMASRPNFEWVD
uniref:Uncharacterized protein n=1 Tax=Nelumbo nucifera TaxID=4432 RepID=A0A822ZHQ2_NELNU|nr:TPA_asm: hypothetical protein HUJ06_001421 [Nelumbo nucifera]